MAEPRGAEWRPAAHRRATASVPHASTPTAIRPGPDTHQRRPITMHIVNTYGLKLIEGRLAHDASLHFRVGYALDGAAAGHASSVVSIVLEPGMAFGEH